MPISGTHTVVGALLGTGLYASGADNLNWYKLTKIVISWFLSPALAATISFSLMVLVSALVMDTEKRKFRSRLLMMQLITAFCFVATVFVMINLMKFEVF